MLENAKWIYAGESFGTVCPFFCKDFSAKDSIQKAVLTITAIGCYSAYLNEKRVGDFLFAPGWTNYEKRLQAQEYDVTAMLQGENHLKIYVGEGWHLGRMTCFSSHVYSAKYPAVICELLIEYSDGTTEKVVSDESFFVGRSKILFSSIYDGETFDARATETPIHHAFCLDYTKQTLIPQEGEKVVETERLSPVKHTKDSANFDVLDFGQNLTGYVEFRCNAPEGTTIEIYHAEILENGSDLYTENLRSAQQKITYIASGKEEVYKPNFTFQGFRYIKVVNWQGELHPEDFTAIVVHSDLKRTGHFKCSNEKVNKLYQNILWGQRGNYLDIPTDCPQRDERCGWTGDTQVFIKTATYNYDVHKFFVKWLNDFSSEQYADGGMPDVIPNVLGEYCKNASAWGDAIILCPWQIYLSYGDKAVLERQYPAMEKWIHFLITKGDEPYLLDASYQHGDWLALDHPDGALFGATDMALIGSAYFAYATSVFVKIGKVLGKDTAEYEALYQNILAAFRKTYLPDGKLSCDTQTANALVIAFDLSENPQPFGDRLAQLIRENGNKLKTGFIGTPLLLHALTKRGYGDVAYSLLLQEEFPSWLYSVNQGATTIWEHWDGINDHGKIWDKSMNSFNHYALGSVGDWMYEVMAGIKIDETAPAFRSIILQPLADERLDYVEASVETAFGTVCSSWHHENGGVKYCFTVPQGATAEIRLKTTVQTVSAGNYEFFEKLEMSKPR